MTPSPTPLPVDPDIIAEATVFAVVAGVVVAFGVIGVISAMLLRAARYPMPVPLIAPLAMLALVAMLIGGLVDEAKELIPIAGAAVGALAAVLTSVFHADKKKGEGDERTDD